MDDLYDTWQANKDRPAWVREHREAIHEHTDTADPIPDSSLAEVRRWVQRYKATVTRQLNPANDTEESDE